MSISDYRRNGNRCPERKVEYGGPTAAEQKRRSWQCQLVAGHQGPHISYSGHRKWEPVDHDCFLMDCHGRLERAEALVKELREQHRR